MMTAPRSAPKPGEPSDEEMVEELRQKMLAPGYQPLLASPIVVGLMFKVSRKTVTSWGLRSAKTGVHSYGGRYDINEVILWTEFLRADDNRTRRAKAS